MMRFFRAQFRFFRTLYGRDRFDWREPLTVQDLVRSVEFEHRERVSARRMAARLHRSA